MANAASFASVDKVDLEDDARLSDLYIEAVRRGWWPGHAAAVLDFWSLAEKALQDDSYGTPGRLFHSLVKSKERGRITDGQEQRAQRRMPSHVREALVARAGAVAAPSGDARRKLCLSVASASLGDEVELDPWDAEPDRIVYHHSIMMMCFLPQKRLPAGQREYIVRHGRAALRIEAGSLIDPGVVGEFRELPVPFGTRARMILPYINASAVRNQSRTVDMGRSLRDFMGRLGLSFDGRRGLVLTEQVEALAAAHLLLGVWNASGGRSHAHLATIADEVSFWIERDVAPALLVGAGDDSLAALLRCDHRPSRATRHGAPGPALAIAAAHGPVRVADVSHGAHSEWSEGACAASGASAGLCP